MSSLPQPLPPVPVQPIMYTTPASNRPGLITAIGVVSIVVGSLGLMFNGIAGLQAFVMMMVSNASKAAATAQQAKTVAATAAPPKPVDPLSMPSEDRQTVLRGLAMHRAISKPRREQLDALLLKCGRQIFRLRGSDLTVEVVRQNVNESDQLPDAKGGEGPDFFIVGEGRIELADDHAKFAPGNGGEIVRVNAFDSGEQPNWQAGLTPPQVKAIIEKVEAQAGATLPAAQKTKLELLLGSPAQEYFDPAPTIIEATDQIQSVSYYNIPGGAAPGSGRGQLSLTTGQGMIVLDGQGNTINSATWGGNAGFGGGGAGINVNMTAAVVALVCAGLSLGLAIYLLVIGILMLRQHPRGGRLHKVYAVLKIPVAIAGGIAWIAFWRSIGAGAGGPGAGFTSAMTTAAVIAIVIGCLYPVALLIALHTRAVWEYYATVT
jgi:hypothetical protein